MAYQTGTATGFNDLTQQLASWLQTQGWTLDGSQADGAGWRAHLHKSGYYIHLKSTASGGPWAASNSSYLSGPCLWAYLSTAYAGAGSNWNLSTTDAPLLSGTSSAYGVGMLLNNGAQSSFHFFHDGSDHYVIVVERTAGLFQQMGFGLSVTKHGGNWTGGAYLHGQIQGAYAGAYAMSDSSRTPFAYNDYYGLDVTGFIRADVDAFTGKWLSNCSGTDANYGYTGKRTASTVPGSSNDSSIDNSIPHSAALRSRATSLANSQAVLLPIRLYAARDAGGYSLLATIPSVFQTNAVGNGYSAGTEIQLGADTYKVFPNFAVKKVA